MYIIISKIIRQLASYRLCLRDFLRFKSFTLKHIIEIHITTKIKLVSTIQMNTALSKQVCQHTMCNGRSNLAFDIIANDRNTMLPKTLWPIILTSNKNRYTVNKRTTTFQNMLHIPFRCHLRTNG